MDILNAGLEQAHIISELRERVAHLQKQAAKWEAQVGILAKRVEQLEANLIKEIESRDGWRDAWKKSEAENERLRELLTGAHVVVSGGSTLNAQWLTEVKQALRDRVVASVVANNGAEK